MTIAEVCDHFVQRELTKDNSWRSYSTKTTRKAYLTRWVIQHCGSVRLSEVRTTEVELKSIAFVMTLGVSIRQLTTVDFN
jgi:integrase